MNEPTEPGAETVGAVTHVLPEIRFTPEGQHTVEQPDDAVPPAQVPHAEVLPSMEPPAEEPPIERHDPFAYMRKAPWMDRRLSASGRAATLLRRDLKAFPVIEGRDPNHADLDAIVKRTVDYIVPIIRRERATDYVYEELEKRRAMRIIKTQLDAGNLPGPDSTRVSGDVDPSGPVERSDTAPPAAPRPARGIAPNVEPPSNSPEFAASLQAWQGRRVILPNGSTVPDSYSPTRFLMSPFDNLSNVAAAGKKTGARFQALLMAHPTDPMRAIEYLYEAMKAKLDHGGDFDYQRRANTGGRPGFTQLRQFRNVSNVNVGLFAQQAGLPLWLVLAISGASRACIRAM
ncbi:MAG: hypothetical protein ACT4O6_26255 [Reyranella sp.]